MSLVDKASKIINERSEEKERMYGPMTEGMISARVIAEYSKGSDNLSAFNYLYGLKLSRQKYNHKEDNLLDAISYRIGLLNAILEENGKKPSKENFDEAYTAATCDMDIDFNGIHRLICALTQLDLKGDDIYKIMLAIEIDNEKSANKKGDFMNVSISIFRQIYIINKMNDFNSK